MSHTTLNIPTPEPQEEWVRHDIPFGDNVEINVILQDESHDAIIWFENGFIPAGNPAEEQVTLDEEFVVGLAKMALEESLSSGQEKIKYDFTEEGQGDTYFEIRFTEK